MVIDNLCDEFRRTRIAQAPYGTGDSAARVIFSHYAAANLSIGMRFHANVVPLGMKKKP